MKPRVKAPKKTKDHIRLKAVGRKIALKAKIENTLKTFGLKAGAAEGKMKERSA